MIFTMSRKKGRKTKKSENQRRCNDSIFSIHLTGRKNNDKKPLCLFSFIKTIIGKFHHKTFSYTEN